MSTFVYMTRCDGCGHCVDICPSDIMHIDENIRRAVNIEPNVSNQAQAVDQNTNLTSTEMALLSPQEQLIRQRLRKTT